MVRLGLYQPDIPQNTGTILRMAACLGLSVDIVEPAGFDVSDRNFRRAGLDYLDHLALTRHPSWRAFEAWRLKAGARLVLATTKGSVPHTEFAFAPGDIVLLGRESAGVPDEVHAAADARVVVPMCESMRSLNIAVAAAIIAGEALRQTNAFPAPLPACRERACPGLDPGSSRGSDGMRGRPESDDRGTPPHPALSPQAGRGGADR